MFYPANNLSLALYIHIFSSYSDDKRLRLCHISDIHVGKEKHESFTLQHTLRSKKKITESILRKIKWAKVTAAQILVSSTIKVLMAVLRHERTWVVLLRTEIREFINRKQRGPVRESHSD